MSLVSRAVLYYLCLFYILMTVLNLHVQSTHAADHEGEGSTPGTTVGGSITEAGKSILKTTSSHTFSFEDVYEINLSLDLPGDIEFVASEGEVVDVILEKQAQATNTESDIATRTYLGNVSVTGTHDNGTLQLKVQLLGGDGSSVTPNPFFGAENLPATLPKQFHLKCIIKTPSDISVKLQSKTGDIRFQRIRGKIEITTETGDVHLNETLGNYNVTLTNGSIKGNILLTRGQNKLETKNGAIELTILDAVAAPMDITTQGGNILLQLPENYAIDALLESNKQQVVINLPVQFEDDIELAIINGGGPLFRLRSTDTISLLQNIPVKDQANIQAAAEPDSFLDAAQPVPQTVKPPVIDGNLSEIVWQTASVLSPFQNSDGTEESESLTETFLIWDAENFYIGVRAHIPNSQLPRISQTQHDSPIWEDECIEILIDANPLTDVYHHFVINPISAFFDQQVSKPGEASFQFAPQDVQLTLNRQAMETAFKANSEWNSDAQVATQINATSWNIEIALPRKMLERPPQVNLENLPDLKNIWLFNIHRKTPLTVRDMEHLISTTQREYSYWLPTYYNEHPWWPHSPHEYAAPLSERVAPAMGLLHFVKRTPSFSETFASEAQFRVASIEVEGNTVMSTKVVQQQVPVQPGDVITSTQLSWILAELQNHEWFKDVRLKTKQVSIDSDASEQLTVISLLVQVTEAPMLFARQIKINGNRTFPTAFIKRWFQLESGYLTVEVARLKQQLIAGFYSNRGYEFATVTYERVNDVLTFTINEGTLHEVRFTGNSRISRTELLSALDLKTADTDKKDDPQASDIYHRTLGQSKINQMRKRLSETNEHFKSIQDWHVQREGGKNIMIVEVEEQPLTKTSGFPILQFNRVHGLVLGAGGTLATRLTGKEQVFGSVSRGFSSEIWNYQGGIEKVFFYWQTLKFGASVYKLTDISSNMSLRPAEISLSAAYYGFAFQDYYQRQGAHGWITFATSEWNFLRLELTTEVHDNLSKSTDWSYLNRNQIKRGNSRIDRGRLESVSLIYAFDTRDHKSAITRYFHSWSFANERTRRGWRGQFGIEMAAGDYAFNFYRFELMRYTPLLGSHNLNVRIGGDFSSAPLPRQRLLHLGGSTNLRGYAFNRFAGDNRVVLNLEYRFIKEIILRQPDAALGWTLSCFLDAGTVWWHGDVPFSDFNTFMGQLKSAVGVGCSIFIDPSGDPSPWSIAVEVAEPLDASFSLQNPKLILRLERIF